jgi:hypothetical protein
VWQCRAQVPDLEFAVGHGTNGNHPASLSPPILDVAFPPMCFPASLGRRT